MDKSFILYTDIGPSILELKDAEVGRLTKAIYRYVMTGELTELKGKNLLQYDPQPSGPGQGQIPGNLPETGGGRTEGRALLREKPERSKCRGSLGNGS